jgi:hypothetical protein
MPNTYQLHKFASGMHYILVDTAVVDQIGDTRALCKLNDAVEFHCALMPKKEGGHYVNIGRSICKQLHLTEGDTVTATFRADHSPYQFNMPEELMAVLSLDKLAHQKFIGLTPGNQRGLIYLVTQVKSSDKRIERALKIADRLKSGVTSPRTRLK